MHVVCISDVALVQPGKRFDYGPGVTWVNQHMLGHGIHQWPESNAVENAIVSERDEAYVAALTALHELDLKGMMAVVSLHHEAGKLFCRGQTWLWIMYKRHVLVPLTHHLQVREGGLQEASSFVDIVSPPLRATNTQDWDMFFRETIAETLAKRLSRAA